MYRYIAMVWDKEDISATQAAVHIRNKILNSPTSWRIAYESKGLTVLHTGENKGRMQACKLENSGGVILGKLFKTSPRGDHSSVDYNLGEGESRKIVKTSGKYLINHYWGRYIAFLNDKEADKMFVLKGPVEGFGSYYFDYHGVTFYFSFFQDISELNLLNFSINWHYIAVYMKFSTTKKFSTALNELFMLQSGECRQYGRGKVTNFLIWSMTKVSSEMGAIEDPMEAAQLLRQTVVGCVTAWAKNHDKIILKLSGGLDSSIILASLMETRNAEDICCLNYFPFSDKSGDERHFARLIAQRFGVQLIEKGLGSSITKMERLFDISPLPAPESYRNALEQYSYNAQLARDIGVNMLFAGEGGDSLFFQPSTHYVTSDYLRKYGLAPNLLTVALNNARRMKKSIWTVLFSAVKDRVINPRGQDLMGEFRKESSILNSEIMKNIDYKDTLNPRLETARDLPNGKLFHIALSEMPNDYYYTSKVDDFLEVCSPLLSQPVIELVLRIPSYVLATGRKDRGLARGAFKNDLPLEILRRESKGGIMIYIQEVLDQNIDFVREILLDGILVKEKLLNRNELEKSLGGSQVLVDSETFNIFEHVCTEIWVRKMMEATI